MELINPITIYGDINLTIHRMWIGSRAITEGQHNFAPKEKRTNYDKILTLAFWKEPTKMLTTMFFPDEIEFFNKIKDQKITFKGLKSKSIPEISQITFEKTNGRIKVDFNGLISEYELDHFNRGISHLFAGDI